MPVIVNRVEPSLAVGVPLIVPFVESKTSPAGSCAAGEIVNLVGVKPLELYGVWNCTVGEGVADGDGLGAGV